MYIFILGQFLEVTNDNWYVGMKVARGRDWIYEGEDISGIGVINRSAYGSHKCAICAIERNHTSLKNCDDTSPLWVMVNWPDDQIYCHRIGDYKKFDLYRHIEGKLRMRNPVFLVMMDLIFFQTTLQ